MTSPPLVVLIHQHRFDTYYQAASIAAASVATGRTTYVVLFLAALSAWLDDTTHIHTFTDMPFETGQRLSAGFQRVTMHSPRAMLEESRRLGLRIFACSGSVEVLDLSRADVLRSVDDIIGLPALFRKIGMDASFVSY